jgi:predicted AAA+ superfamily ATPase
MLKIFPRRLERQIAEALDAARVVALLGARQSGKSWLANRFTTSERPYLTLDDLGQLAQAEDDPVGFIASLPPKVIIDEIQRVPKLLLPVKVAVDQKPEKGRFLLTGSANLLTLPKLADSLAGRMIVLELFPLAQAEIEQTKSNVVEQLFTGTFPWTPSPVNQANLAARIIRGGYPDAVLAPDDATRSRWFDGYLLTLIQRDIREIAHIADVAAMSRVLQTLAPRCGSLLNYTSLASAAEIPKSTIIRYISALEQAFLVHRIPSWSFDLSRRLTKLPKLHLADSGIAAHLMHVDAERILKDRNLFGGLLETFVANELRKHTSWSDRRIQLYHYRSHAGIEVDFILESPAGERIAIEVKTSATLSSSDFRSIAHLMDDPKMKLARGVVLYTGSTIVPARENLHGIPISIFWS